MLSLDEEVRESIARDIDLLVGMVAENSCAVPEVSAGLLDIIMQIHGLRVAAEKSVRDGLENYMTLLVRLSETSRELGEARGRLAMSEVAGVVEAWRARALDAEGQLAGVRPSDLPRIFVDLDGVVFDFEGYFLTRFGFRHDASTDKEMWKCINSDPDFFGSLPLLPGAERFMRYIAPLSPIILTACPKSDYPRIARLKRTSVVRELGAIYPEGITFLPVTGGINKALFLHKKGDILIDDMDKNIYAWIEEGGTGIHHYGSFDKTVELLQSHCPDVLNICGPWGDPEWAAGGQS